MYTKIFLINLTILLRISFSISWNSNHCAWGALNTTSPINPSDCLGDQSNQISNCCFLKLLLMGNKEYKICLNIPKYLVDSATDEELAKSLQNDIINVFEITELICRSSIPVIPDTRNEITHNSCGYDKVKFNPPKEINDCTYDVDPSFSSRCCYVESTLNKENKNITSCMAISKVREFDQDTWNTVFKSMGMTLLKMDCNSYPKVENDKLPTPQTTLLKNNGYNLKTFNFIYNLLIIICIFIFIT